MKKLFKKVTAILCAVTMVFTGITFSASTVGAKETGGPLPADTWETHGAWQLYNGHMPEWFDGTMNYEVDGNELGDTTMILTNSPEDCWDDVVYSLQARLKDYCKDKMDVDMPYKAQIKIKSSMISQTPYDSRHPEDGDGSELVVQIGGNKNKVYNLKIDKSKGGEEVTLTTPEFDYEEFDTDDISFALGNFPTGARINITSVEFIPQPTDWTPVANTNPDPELHEEMKWTSAGKFDLAAMYGPTSETDGMYGKLKYKMTGTGSDVSDTTVKVISTSGWGKSWSTMAKLTGFNSGLEVGEEYKGTIVVESSKATTTDEEGNVKQLWTVVDKNNTIKKSLNEGETTITVDPFVYRGNEDIIFELDGLEKGTEFKVKSIVFEKSDPTWTAVPNNRATQAGKWVLKALTDKEHTDRGQWGALSYRNNGEATSIADTDILVRSASGWHDANATQATLVDYLAGKVDLGYTYAVDVEYYSSAATKTDSSGKAKTVLLKVGKTNQLKFKLEKCEEGETKHAQFIKDKNTFTFENDGTNPLDMVFNLDEVEAQTQLSIKSVTFSKVNDGWEPVENFTYFDIGNTGMQARALFDVDSESWGKMSYKFDSEAVKDDYSKVLVKNRTVSGWARVYNPTNALRFKDFTDGDLTGVKMTKANKYKIRAVVQATRTDEVIEKDGTDDQKKNNLYVRIDGDKIYEFKNLPDEQDFTVETPEFMIENPDNEEANKHLSFIMDEFTDGSTFRIKSIEVIKSSTEPEWTPVDNADTKTVGPWSLYANTDPTVGPEGIWGEIYYHTDKENPTELGDVDINAYSVSGWFGARSIQATLNNYLDGKLERGKNYSVAITMKSNKDIVKTASPANQMRVNIDDEDYDFEAYEGEYTYVIPYLNKDFRNLEDKKNVAFFLDEVPAKTQLTISSVSFNEETVDSPVEVSDVTTSVNNSKVTVNWNLAGDTEGNKVYIGGQFKVYVDGVATTVNPNMRTFTTDALSNGNHTIKVTSVLGTETAGKTVTVKVGGDTTTQAPTSESPTETSKTKPTQSPTKAATKPGKATVKKAVKKKSAKKIKVTLKKVAGATKYQVAVYKTKKNAKKNKKALVKKYVTKLTATIKSKKLKGKKTVYVRARAWNAAGFGAWSGVKKSKKK